jgi:hypothetical protein
MKMVGHKTESVYRRYSIVDESMLRDAEAGPAPSSGPDTETESRSEVRKTFKAVSKQRLLMEFSRSAEFVIG